MIYRQITKADDEVLAKIIRANLKAHSLDIPGTVYFDKNLDHLSDYYLDNGEKRFYYILTDESENIIGGVGLAEFSAFDSCAELQKLYLIDSAKGQGLGYKLIELIEEKARALAYKRIYLETHDNLSVAIHLYKKCGYIEIEKPKEIVHSTMTRFFLKDL